jgi:hypothetical protein
MMEKIYEDADTAYSRYSISYRTLIADLTRMPGDQSRFVSGGGTFWRATTSDLQVIGTIGLDGHSIVTSPLRPSVNDPLGLVTPIGDGPFCGNRLGSLTFDVVDCFTGIKIKEIPAKDSGARSSEDGLFGIITPAGGLQIYHSNVLLHENRRPACPIATL